MLDRLRTSLDSYLLGVGRLFSRVNDDPTVWTIVGLGISLVCALAFSVRGYTGELLGGILILFAGAFDIVDGSVARVTGKVSKRGSFLDSTLDRVAEVAIFVGILLGRHAGPLVVLLGLSLSLLVSYTRAKGDSLGVTLSGVGIGERSERLLVLAVAGIVGTIYWGVVVVILLAGFTFLERTFRAARSLS